MQKVRVALIAGKMVGGGVESVMMNIIRYIDDETYDIDILVDEDSSLVPVEIIEKYGAKVIYVPPYQQIFKYLRRLKNIFSENSYQIVHANISALNIFPLMIAKLCGVPVRISHNHNLIAPNAGFFKNSLKRFFSLFSNIFPNYRIAPTKETGIWMFRKKPFFIVKNGIEVDKFKFNPSQRKKIRHFLNLKKDDFLIGSFGRMISSKKLFFLIRVIKAVIKKGKNVKLLLIGNGSVEKDLKKMVNTDKSLKDNVVFLNSQEKIHEFYSALDVYVFPSTSEAFGLAAVEAQINGLYTIVSGGVPDEAKVLDELFCKCEDYSIEKWAKKVKDSEMLTEAKRDSLSKSAATQAFNAKKMVLEIEVIYQNAIRKEK
ncbi:glycosyltransferase [Pediococcus acidilactici]|uniref:glycosyltransferase n=1 Tax=Pediococcus acidilactici TaxID=1254 RepID=UPI0010587295|nr:glycosyltransferase [Pediococcus acidilactici]KAF0514934.1 glycosyltransferase [Pediococcus acidilactici]MCT3036807.1 glycosyltransferase family 1 protein [Pediococcus acidilactici]QQC45233.1 glycosyltransferase [Pediococcus acidilactici]